MGSIRPLLEKGYSQERKSNAGRKRINPLILFKMLVLQQLFNLSDEEVEFQVNDGRSFEEFVGLGVMNDIPDATTVAFLKRYLRDHGLEAVTARIRTSTPEHALASETPTAMSKGLCQTGHGDVRP